MSTSTDDNTSISTCANCGRGEESTGDLKSCTACKMVKYCNRDCQIAHRPQHKKECKKRAAELHDEALFKQPPHEDCLICFLRLPALQSGWKYKTCCGKRICSGCIHAVGLTAGDNICPFCRAPVPNSPEEAKNRMMKRVEIGDAEAIYALGCNYHRGLHDFPQNHEKALELWRRAAELGNSMACCNIGTFYFNGEGVERNKKKGKHYCELSAMGGNIDARHNLGIIEEDAGNMDRALKHYMIAVVCGCGHGNGNSLTLKAIKKLYTNGYATKDDYTQALKAYQAYLGEIRSDDRDKAAAFSDGYKYYE